MESTIDRWIPLQMVSNAESVSMPWRRYLAEMTTPTYTARLGTGPVAVRLAGPCPGAGQLESISTAVSGYTAVSCGWDLDVTIGRGSQLAAGYNCGAENKNVITFTF